MTAIGKADNPATQRVRISTLALLTLGTFDLVTTLMWLKMGGLEGNPVFNYFAERGSLALVGAKLAFLFGPVLMLEYARKYRPVTAEIGTWAAFLGYLYLYATHLLAMR